jgi:hypothetical protein
MSGNQYFTRVYNNVNGPSVVQQAQVEGGQALTKELVCYCEPRANGNYALLNTIGGTAVTLPVGSYVTEVIYKGNGLTGAGTYIAGLAATAGAVATAALTAGVALAASNVGNNAPLVSTATPVVSSSVFLTLNVASGPTTGGSLQVRVLYV